jgi:hypothetical protein
VQDLIREPGVGELLFRAGPATTVLLREAADGTLEVIAVSDAVAEAAGAAPADLHGRRLDEVVAPGLAALVHARFAELGDAGSSVRGTASAEGPAGRRCYDLTLISLGVRDGLRCAVSASIDTTSPTQVFDVHDDIVQGLATVRLALMQDDREQAMQMVDRTLEAARGLVSDLLRERLATGPTPGDLIRVGSAGAADR